MKKEEFRFGIILVILIIFFSSLTLSYGENFEPGEPKSWSQINSQSQLQQISPDAITDQAFNDYIPGNMKGEALKYKYNNPNIEFNNLPQNIRLQDNWLTHNNQKIFNFENTKRKHKIEYKDDEWEIDDIKGAREVEEKEDDNEDNQNIKIAQSEKIEIQAKDNKPQTHAENIVNAFFDALGFALQQASYLEIGNTKFANVQDLSYQYETKQTTFSSADSFVDKVAELIKPTQSKITPKTLTTKQADIISTKEVTLTKVKDVEITFDENNEITELKLTSDKDDNIFKLKNVDIVLDYGGSLKYKDGEYEITNGRASHSIEDIEESVKVDENGKVSFSFDRLNGFYTITLSKDAEYSADVGVDGSDFKIIPKVDDYKIFIRKTGTDVIDTSSMTNNDYAVVDFASSSIQMNGLADFYKLSERADSDFTKMIDSNDAANEFSLTFDSNFINFDLQSKGAVANIYLGNYKLIEGENTIVEFSHPAHPNYLKSYDNTKLKVSLTDGKLQTSKTTLFHRDIAKQNLKQEIDNYKPQHCEQCHLYYNNDQPLLNYIDKVLVGDGGVTGNDVTGAFIGYNSNNQTGLFLLFALLFLSTLTIYRMKSKKSQITVFIALGIVILIVFAILYITIAPSMTTKATTFEQFDTTSVKAYMSDCLNKVAQCSLTHQGLNFGYITIDDDSDELNTNTFQEQTKQYLDKVGLECYQDMPQALKYNIKVNTFNSDIHYLGNSIIDIDTDMTARSDTTEQDISTYKINPKVNINKLIQFTQNINQIDLAYLESSEYRINIYEIDNKPLYVITDPGSEVFGKEFKIVR